MSAILLDPSGTKLRDKLLLPSVVPSQEELDDWRHEFQKEKDRTDKAWRDWYRFNNSSQNYSGLNNWNSQGNTPASYTATAITDVGPLPDFTIPAGIPVGTVLRITAVGQFVAASGSTTLNMQFMYGGTGGTSLAATGAITVTASATNIWKMQAKVRFTAQASSGTTAMSHLWQQGISTTANIGVPVQYRNVTIAANTLTANTIIVTATAGVAFTSLNVDTFIIEQLN
jgi:hypothetical protein